MRFPLALGLGLLGCAAPGPEFPPATPPTPAPSLAGSGATGADSPVTGPQDTEEAQGSEAGPDEPVLGWVAAKPITARDLLLLWNQDASRDVFLAVEKLVSIRLALAEAQRLGMRLEPEDVELEVTRARQAISQELAERALDLSLDEFVESQLGLRSEVYFDRMRAATIRRMLTERAVRAHTLANEWARVRMIVVATKDEADALRARIDGGEDFGDLAREKSLDATAEAGGLVPFLQHSEGSALTAAVFAAEPGDLVGPFPMAGHQVLARVEELHEPHPGDWDEVGAPVEASLAAQPVTDSEFVQWKLAMERRYPIDLRPLEELLGAVR